MKKKYDGTTKKKLAKASKSNALAKARGKLRQKHDSTGSGDDSPLASPSPSDANVPIHRRRRSEQHAYDINNIVIPYSIAASTRVERLKYKEILTPKWRLIDELENEATMSEVDGNETDEDISDDAFALRHLKCEADERKHFCSFLKNPHGGNRGRGARLRFDSTKSDSEKNNAVNSASAGSVGKDTVNHHKDLSDQVHNVNCSSQDSLVTSKINIALNSKDLKDTIAASQAVSVASEVPTTTSSATAAVASAGNNVQNSSTYPSSSSLNNTMGQQGPHNNSLVQEAISDETQNSVDSLYSSGTPVSSNPVSVPSKTHDRVRTSSSSRKDDLFSDDHIIEIAPYEKRRFPIPEDEFQEMVRVSVESFADSSSTSSSTGAALPTSCKNSPRRSENDNSEDRDC